ncbi:MAG: hypothetical protein ACFFER_03490 [Candidatus Thorarchaeota archaeon]
MRRIPDETRRKISDTKRGIERKDDVRTQTGDSLDSFLSAPRNEIWYETAKDLAEAYRNTGEWKRKSKNIQKRDEYTCQGYGFTREEFDYMGFITQRNWLNGFTMVIIRVTILMSFL